MKLPIAYYGIQEVNDEIRQLIKDMEETMRSNNGMGLAAPQVFRSLALFIICPPIPNPQAIVNLGDMRKFKYLLIPS